MQLLQRKWRVVQAGAAHIAVFVATIPVWVFARRYGRAVQHNRLAAFANAVFVQHYGYVWFTAAHAGHVLLHTDQHNRIPSAAVARHALKYALVTACFVLVQRWCFGAPLVERINAASGGHCEPSPLPMAQCKRRADAVWVDGFDLLSHYYILVSLGLMLWDLRDARPVARAAVARVAQLVVVPLSTFLLAVWFVEFAVTSIFFHSVGERLAGLVAIPVVAGTLVLDYWIFRGDAGEDPPRDFARASSPRTNFCGDLLPEGPSAV